MYKFKLVISDALCLHTCLVLYVYFLLVELFIFHSGRCIQVRVRLWSIKMHIEHGCMTLSSKLLMLVLILSVFLLFVMLWLFKEWQIDRLIYHAVFTSFTERQAHIMYHNVFTPICPRLFLNMSRRWLSLKWIIRVLFWISSGKRFCIYNMGIDWKSILDYLFLHTVTHWRNHLLRLLMLAFKCALTPQLFKPFLGIVLGHTAYRVA